VDILVRKGVVCNSEQTDKDVRGTGIFIGVVMSVRSPGMMKMNHEATRRTTKIFMTLFILRVSSSVFAVSSFSEEKIYPLFP
jgi:hypothetical protein